MASVTLAFYSQITKAEVDQFKPELEIPHCSLRLCWTGGDKIKPLLHKVALRGAKSPKDFFYLAYSPQAAGESRICPSLYLMLHGCKQG